MRMRSVLSTFALLAILVFCCATLVFAARSTQPSTKTFASTGRSSSRGSSTGRSSSRGLSSSGRSEEVDLFLTGKGSSGTGRKGKSSGDALQLAELLKTILETFEKFEPIDLDDKVDKGEWKNGIIIFSEGKFWKQLFKNGNSKQLMTLKEFHQKYGSTLTAEFLFLDLKRWFKMHSNWEGKGKTDAKLEEELVKMLQDMYKLFFMPWSDDSNKIANVFGLNKDEIVLRVLDKDDKPQNIKLVFVKTSKNQSFYPRLSDTNMRKNKFTFNNYDTSKYKPEKLTVADMVSMEHAEELELFVCEPRVGEAKSKGDCDSYLVNLQDKRNKKLLGAKKGRFIVKSKMSKKEADRVAHWGIDAYIEVDNNPWEE